MRNPRRSPPSKLRGCVCGVCGARDVLRGHHLTAHPQGPAGTAKIVATPGEGGSHGVIHELTSEDMAKLDVMEASSARGVQSVEFPGSWREGGRARARARARAPRPVLLLLLVLAVFRDARNPRCGSPNRSPSHPPRRGPTHHRTTNESRYGRGCTTGPSRPWWPLDRSEEPRTHLATTDPPQPAI